jgi:hypothetical protein
VFGFYVVDGRDEPGVAFVGHHANPRARRQKGVARDRAAMALSVEDVGPAAAVSGRIASAAAQDAQAPRYRDLDRNPVLAQAGDLSILVDCGREENSCHRGERDHTGADEAASDTAAVHLHMGPSKGRDGLEGRGDRRIVVEGLQRGPRSDLGSGSSHSSNTRVTVLKLRACILWRQIDAS